ncbi:MAG: hypothetical protein M3Y44_12530 [Actinomycetota bacterium]|nr:hypothetical protein [Actinomycetota bacterium]
MIADLSSIEGLNAKRLAALADALSIRTPGELVRADRRAILAALRKRGLRPTLEEISTWQDDARDTAAAGDPGWEQVAAFVVSFEQRRSDDVLERRVAAEQAEHELPAPRAEWSDWNGAAVYTWMLDLLPAARMEGAGSPDLTDRADPDRQDEPAAERPDNTAVPATAARRSARPALAIKQAELLIVGKTPVGLIPDAEEVVDIPPGTRLKVTLSESAAGRQIQVALRVRRPGRAALTPHPPASATAEAPVEIDLSALPSGTHTAVLAAWTEDGSIAPTVHKLPTLRIAAPDRTNRDHDE